MTKAEKAIDYMKNNCNCCQAIVATFGPELGLSETQGLKLATGFGAGMGKMQKTCGAVTGAFIILGQKYGTGKDVTPEIKNLVYEKVTEFSDQFTSKVGSIECMDILGYDMNTPEGKAEIDQQNLFAETCAHKAVKNAAIILEEIIKD